jgi:hypothetical protein
MREKTIKAEVVKIYDLNKILKKYGIDLKEI